MKRQFYLLFPVILVVGCVTTTTSTTPLKAPTASSMLPAKFSYSVPIDDESVLFINESSVDIRDRVTKQTVKKNFVTLLRGNFDALRPYKDELVGVSATNRFIAVVTLKDQIMHLAVNEYCEECERKTRKLGFSPDGELFYVLADDDGLNVYDWQKAERVGRYPSLGHASPLDVSSFTVLSDGTVAVALTDSIKIYDADLQGLHKVIDLTGFLEGDPISEIETMDNGNVMVHKLHKDDRVSKEFALSP